MFKESNDRAIHEEMPLTHAVYPICNGPPSTLVLAGSYLTILLARRPGEGGLNRTLFSK